MSREPLYCPGPIHVYDTVDALSGFWLAYTSPKTLDFPRKVAPIRSPRISLPPVPVGPVRWTAADPLSERVSFPIPAMSTSTVTAISR